MTNLIKVLNEQVITVNIGNKAAPNNITVQGKGREILFNLLARTVERSMYGNGTTYDGCIEWRDSTSDKLRRLEARRDQDLATDQQVGDLQARLDNAEAQVKMCQILHKAFKEIANSASNAEVNGEDLSSNGTKTDADGVVISDGRAVA